MILTVNPEFLISKNFSRHTKNALNLDDDNILTYYIDDVSGGQMLADGRSITTLAHSDDEIAFIESMFDDLDSNLAIDFERAASSRSSDIDIYSVVKVSGWDRDTLGEVADQEKQRRAGSWWDVLWRDTDGKNRQNNSDLYSIIHETGHALGLSHPKEKPFSPRWDSSDTVMSYNPSPEGYNTSFSASDVEALQLIWGLPGGSQQPDSGVEMPVQQGGSSKEVIGSGRADDLIGGTGDDDIFGFAGDDYADGGAGDDVIFGDRGDDILVGGKGDDILEGGKGFNLAEGGRGRDLFVIAPKGYLVIDDFQIKQDDLWILNNGKTYWNWGWETSGNRTYLYDMKTGDDFAELKGRHNLDRASVFS